ncbi:unnamed protein product [Orchesella dallaii]|uniref:Uncharacterized protein n=1 Tax=Orchesella dallaii TaxID=48710 RepID=A0ABP1QCE7_9HEXA
MESKYISLFALVCIVVATVLILPSESTPLTKELEGKAHLTDSAPVDTNRQGRQYFGYPMGGFGGSSASASASASSSGGGYGMGGYPMMKKKNYNGYLSHYMFVKRAKSESRDLFEYFLEEISKLRFDPDEEGVAIEEVEPLVFTDSESEEEIE